MSAKAIKDTYGTLWRIAAAKTDKQPNGKQSQGVPSIDVWWDRDAKDKPGELLVIRQENAVDRADVIMCSLGQLYDLIDAANKAVETP